MKNHRTIYSRFYEQVKQNPESIAICTDKEILTYAQLDAFCDAILAKFSKRNPGSVGIVMSHGPMQIAAMLAVLKNGSSYVPAEPFLPKERIEYMMKMAGVDLIITDEFCKSLSSAKHTFTDKSVPDGVAYVLFTSGTSGKPKGVVVENHSVVNYCEAFEEEFKVGRGDVMHQYSVCSFDIFVEEVFTTLLNGAALAIPSKEIRNGDLAGLMDFCERHNVTIIDGFPYLIADIDKSGRLPEGVRLIVSGGDVIRASYITNLRDRNVKIYNTYGPSETTVCSNYFRVDNANPLEDGTFPVGKPVKGVTIRILDENLNPVKPGEIGEIVIEGEGVSRGYLGNPPEQKNFLISKDGKRMYRSGDMGYILPDGNLAFLRRKDSQVMILGKRVEPDEVENVLEACPCVEHGVVRAFLDDFGLHYLVAYIVAKAGCKVHDVRTWLEARLTDFMVPEFFVKLTHIPLTRRGKVDTKALPVVLKEGGI